MLGAWSFAIAKYFFATKCYLKLIFQEKLQEHHDNLEHAEWIRPLADNIPRVDLNELFPNHLPQGKTSKNEKGMFSAASL